MGGADGPGAGDPVARAQVGRVREPGPPDAVLHGVRGPARPAGGRPPHVRAVRHGLLSPAREEDEVQGDHREVCRNQNDPCPP